MEEQEFFLFTNSKIGVDLLSIEVKIFNDSTFSFKREK